MTTKDVASGTFDSLIRDYARAIKRWGEPLFIRGMCGEMNGSWLMNCSPRANPTLTAADYVKAFRRAVDIFRREGICNVAWLWTPYVWDPNREDPGPGDKDLDSYRPGDDHVDWVGVDNFDDPPRWMDPIYAYASAHHKPVIVAEFGTRNKGGHPTTAARIAWLEAMFYGQMIFFWRANFHVATKPAFGAYGRR